MATGKTDPTGGEDFLSDIFARLDRSATTTVAPPERRPAATHWQSVIQSIPDIQPTPHPGDRDPRSETLVRFRFTGTTRHDAVSAGEYRDSEFRIAIARDQTLRLRTGGSLPGRTGVTASLDTALVDRNQIETLVDHLRRRASRIRAEQQRQTAVDALRLRCIQQQINPVLPDHWQCQTTLVSDDLIATLTHPAHPTIRLTWPIKAFQTAAAEAAPLATAAVELSRYTARVQVNP